jgi:RNA polymerase sigma-70 factor (ECF subfamily)
MTPSRDPGRPAPTPSGSGDVSVVIRRAVAGDPEAVARLVESFTPALVLQADLRLGPALRRLVDPLDVVNDAWFAALRRLGDFRADEGRVSHALLSYLGVAVLRRIQELHRKHLAGKPLTTAIADPGAGKSGAPELSDSVTGAVTHALRAERRDLLRRAVAELEEVDRLVVVARSIEGQEIDEVARMAGLSPNAVSQRHRRALQKLRGLLPAAVFDDDDEP